MSKRGGSPDGSVSRRSCVGFRNNWRLVSSCLARPQSAQGVVQRTKNLDLGNGAQFLKRNVAGSGWLPLVDLRHEGCKNQIKTRRGIWSRHSVVLMASNSHSIGTKNSGRVPDDGRSADTVSSDEPLLRSTVTTLFGPDCDYHAGMSDIGRMVDTYRSQIARGGSTGTRRWDAGVII